MEKLLKTQGFVALSPAEGKWLTNGEIVSDSVFTPNGLESKWRDCTKGEANAIRAKAGEMFELNE